MMPMSNPFSVLKAELKMTRSYTCMVNTGTARASRLTKNEIIPMSRYKDRNGARISLTQPVDECSSITASCFGGPTPN